MATPRLTVPPGLGTTGERAWKAARDELKDRGDLRPADEFALERYARAVDMERKCWDQVAPDLKATGSMGQPVTDPLVDSALKAAKAAELFAKALGIEVAARLDKNKGGRPQTTTVMQAGGQNGPRSPEPPALSPLRAVS